MSHVLIIDDEEVLRHSMARGVAKMEDVEVSQAGSLDEALRRIDTQQPDLVVSDIDMPERSGIELLGELGKRGLSIPVIFVSAYLKAFRAQIPRHANLEAVEKPLPLEDLRALIADKLARGQGDPAPFSVPDYLQLACMGRHSVMIEAHWPSGSDGQIIVHAGEVWSAKAGQLQGRAAFAEVAFRPGARIQCRRIDAPPGPRTLDGSAEGLLMDCARLLDENSRAGASTTMHSQPAPRPQTALGSCGFEELDLAEREGLPATDPNAPRAEAPEQDMARQVFDRHWDQGITALLKKDYRGAWDAFRAANALQPGNPTVLANLDRLRAMGHGDSDKDDET